MRYFILAFSSGMLAVLISGCSTSAKRKSEQDISRGNEKLDEMREKQHVEDLEGRGQEEITQTDTNFEREAMDEFDQAIRDDPKNPEAYYARGFDRLAHSDSMSKAIDDFNKAIELKPDYARAYLMRGRAYEALGDMEKANADRAMALKLQPGID